METMQATRFYKETGLNFSTMMKTNLNLLAVYRVQIFCDWAKSRTFSPLCLENR